MNDIKKIKEDIKKVKTEINNLPNFNIQDLKSEDIKNKIIAILIEAENSANEVDKINSIKKEIENRIIIPIDNRIKEFNTKSNIFTIISYFFGILGIILTIYAYFDSQESNKYIINKMIFLSNQNDLIKSQTDIIKSRFEDLEENKSVEFNKKEIYYLKKIDSLHKILSPNRINPKLFKLFLAYDSLTSKFGFVNYKETSIPFIFDKADEFSGNVARVMVKNKWGVINNSGKFVIYPKYQEMSSIYKGHFIALYNEWSLFDVNGKKRANVFDYLNWDIFQKEVEKSNVQDKELILRSLSMYSDPLVRYKEIMNLSKVYLLLNDLLIDMILKQL